MYAPLFEGKALVFFVVGQFLSHVQLFATPWTAACHTSLSIISWRLLKLMSIELVISSNISFSVIYHLLKLAQTHVH